MRQKNRHWIDNADSYICPVCRFECKDPSVYDECKCPKCGFQDDEGAECPTCYGTRRIGTSDWLTKGVTRKRLAKEKQKAIEEYESDIKNTGAIEALDEIKKVVYKLYKDTQRYSRYKCTSLIGQCTRGALLDVIDEINKLKKIYKG